MISVRNISKDFGNGPVLQDVSLEIEKGESVVIIGLSGCGKSTFLRCINRLIEPDQGEIFIDGENILDKNTDINRIRRKMGMVYQHFNLFSHLSVLENLILAPMKVLGMSREDAVQEAKALLEKVGMAGRENAMPSELSGGQKQRVAIARALAMHPEVILFDEPTSALDPTMVDEVESVIRSLVDEGLTSIIVTHEMQFAKKVATKVLFFAERGIYEQGTPEEVFEHPKKVLMQRFLFRKRMFEETLQAESLDLYALLSRMRQFLQRYETSQEQNKLLSVVADELIYPLFNAAERPARCMQVRLICSETGSNHMLRISVQDIAGDPLMPPYLDSLNISLLEKYAVFVYSRENEKGWEICIQM